MPTPTADPTPSAAPGPEIKLGNRRSGSITPLPDSVLAAIQAEANKNAPQPAAEAQPPPEPPKAPATPPTGNGTSPAPKEKPLTVPATTPHTPKEPPKSDKEENLARLREKAERLEREASEAKNSLTTTAKEKADIELKRAEAEAKLQAALEREEKDYKPVIERLKATEDQLNKQREVLKMKAYQETPEFHEKFIAPVIETQRDIQDFLGQIEVPLQDGSRRPATMQDFNVVMAAGSHTAAREVAKAYFGEDAQTILNYRLRLQSHNKNREEAHKRAGEMAIEYEQRTQQAILQQQQQFKGSVYAEAERLLKESLQVDDDPEEKEAFAAAQQFADGLWNNDNETVEQVVKKAAKARKNNIEAPVLRKKLDRATKRISELEDQLKAYQKSEPELKPRGGGTTPPVTGVGEKPERAAMLAAAQAMATSLR